MCVDDDDDDDVPTLPGQKWIVKFPRVQQLILVLFPQYFFSF